MTNIPIPCKKCLYLGEEECLYYNSGKFFPTSRCLISVKTNLGSLNKIIEAYNVPPVEALLLVSEGASKILELDIYPYCKEESFIKLLFKADEKDVDIFISKLPIP